MNEILLAERRIERAITHLDLDYEIAHAATYRWQRNPKTGLLSRRPMHDGPGSFITGTNVEALFSNKFAYTAKNTFTTEFNIADTASGNPLWTLQPGTLFQPGAMAGKAFRVVARGIQLGTGSTPPTWLWTFRMNPTLTPAVPPTGPIVAGGAAAITGTVTASTLWEAEFDVQLTVEAAAGNNSTLRGLGTVVSPRGLVSPFGMDLFGAAASPGTVATFDWSIANTLTVGITCGTSLAANQMQLLDTFVFGLN
jgi:hypothetical protein